MDFYYRIRGLSPPAQERHMKGWGFNIELDLEFAKRALHTPLSKASYKSLQKDARDYIINCGWKPEAIRRDPLDFCELDGIEGAENSRLLHHCEVPGSASGLAFDFNMLQFPRYEQVIIYSPDNIDYMSQSMASLALWLRWFEFVRAGFEL